MLSSPLDTGVTKAGLLSLSSGGDWSSLSRRIKISRFYLHVDLRIKMSFVLSCYYTCRRITEGK